MHYQQLNRIGSSDYNTVLSHLCLNPKSEKSSPRTVRLWDKVKWPPLKRALVATDWSTFYVTMNMLMPSLPPSSPPKSNTSLTGSTGPNHETTRGLVTDVAWKRRRNIRHGCVSNALHVKTTKTAVWARERWENDTERKLFSNQIGPQAMVALGVRKGKAPPPRRFHPSDHKLGRRCRI